MRDDLMPSLGTAGLVKVCGLTDEAGVRAATGAGADLIGLVFVEASRRCLGPREAGKLARMAAGEAAVVGLFQDPALSEVEEVLESVPLDLIQLHGGETEEDVARIGAGFGLPVVKAVGVATRGDLYAAAGMPAELMLYDAKAPVGAGAAGGHGAAFDWDVLDAAPTRPPWLLAGGLTPDNVAGAVAACAGREGFAGVDVSSGVESAPGVKDPALIVRFIAATRAAMAGVSSPDAFGDAP